VEKNFFSFISVPVIAQVAKETETNLTSIVTQVKFIVKQGGTLGIASWERKEFIKQRLLTEGKVGVSELAKELAVSEVTVRHDLKYLSRQGLVIRTYGGAIRKENAFPHQYLFQEKTGQHIQEKKAIARVAVRLIEAGQVIFLDTGTTVLEIAGLLATLKINLTVVTTSLPVVSTLLTNESIRLLVVGGFLRRQLYDFFGPATTRQIQELSFHQCFLGVDGFSSKTGLTTTDMETATLEEAVLECSNLINIVADSSKIGRTCLLSYGNIFQQAKPKRLITDKAAPEKELKNLRQAGFQILLAQNPAKRKNETA